VSKIDNDNKNIVASNPAAEIDKGLALNPCPEAGYDQTNSAHKFSCEFQQAILKFSSENNVKDNFGNWFGRMVAFGYVVDVKGTKIQEFNDASNVTHDEFRQKLRDKVIKIKTYSTNFKKVIIAPDPNDKKYQLITAEVTIHWDGIPLNGTYNVTYKVKDAGWEAAEVKIE
jgi:hypothetical protein